ncbi:1-acyl-sn-glycerol-3-phosphate acyltransferase [Thiospirillum jenense]|uniref:1-acyl-sn-glycerol-3-phosphate acyltransferase n=1 Tax=Thiospirillum jenense TaxID=1653858 RepID=A0A839HDT1_9GAMM|nr:1-acyl-sn-glycerol-3-phosphate acyltransferase [Thiospirillum jenense]
MLILRSMLFMLAFAIITIGYGLAIVFSAKFVSELTLARIARNWGHVSLWLLRVICNVSYVIRGVEYLQHQPAVVLANHQSAWETLALRALLPLKHTWVLKSELLKIPVFGWALAILRPISIQRHLARQALKQVLLQGEQALNAGYTVVIFPEGTRKDTNELGEFNIGGAKLAERAQVSVIPIAHNAGTVWRRRSFIKYPGVIRMEISAPIEVIGKTAAEINQITQQWIQSTLAQSSSPP